MSWQHIRPDTLAWSAGHGGTAATKHLTDRPFPVRLVKCDPQQTITFSGMGLCCAGSGTFAAGTGFCQGDLVWRARGEQLTAGDAGCAWYALELPASLQPGEANITVGAKDRPWQDFEDPAGRPTQPVQILLEGSLSALRTRFVPGYIAGEHWHDFDTLYFIMDGDMQFGFEGQYYTGDIRQVQGGFSYGPEKPGPLGVEFVLFSCGGPVNLHWHDLDPSPHGPLTD